ncbi:hypothetical protein F5X99DRAFT_431928 [Biscogniauxia marginata]|nr:hypothetical protein F5X99DRAFT_431928 [Biscogniauxia marginata]
MSLLMGSVFSLDIPVFGLVDGPLFIPCCVIALTLTSNRSFKMRFSRDENLQTRDNPSSNGHNYPLSGTKSRREPLPYGLDPVAEFTYALDFGDESLTENTVSVPEYYGRSPPIVTGDATHYADSIFARSQHGAHNNGSSSQQTLPPHKETLPNDDARRKTKNWPSRAFPYQKLFRKLKYKDKNTTADDFRLGLEKHSSRLEKTTRTFQGHFRQWRDEYPSHWAAIQLELTGKMPPGWDEM